MYSFAISQRYSWGLASANFCRHSAKMPFELVECAAPPFLMAATGLLAMQPRMSERQLGAFGNGAKIELQERLTGILAIRPAPAHRQPPRLNDLEIFAAALMLAAVKHAEANP